VMPSIQGHGRTRDRDVRERSERTAAIKLLRASLGRWPAELKPLAGGSIAKVTKKPAPTLVPRFVRAEYDQWRDRTGAAHASGRLDRRSPARTHATPQKPEAAYG